MNLNILSSGSSENGNISSETIDKEFNIDDIPGYEGLMGYVGSMKENNDPNNVTIIGTYPGYKLTRVIGSGYFGKVYEAIRDSDGKYVALKVIDTTRVPLDDLNREVEVLSRISKPTCQPYLVCFNRSEYIKEENLLLIEMDMVKGSTLDKFANTFRNSKKFNKYLLLIMNDVIKAISYLHNNNILHNDIKPDNIIINGDLEPVLVDMGVSCYELSKCSINGETRECCNDIKGPTLYLSPETAITKGGYFKESDIWDLGLTFYVVSTGGKYPFDLGSPPSSNNLVRALKTQQPSKLKSGNEILDYVVNRCLDKNPLTRITLSEISEILSDI